MSDNTNADNIPVVPKPPISNLPSQTSPQDTSNWDNRPFTAPDGKVHIGTEQSQLQVPTPKPPQPNINP